MTLVLFQDLAAKGKTFISELIAGDKHQPQCWVPRPLLLQAGGETHELNDAHSKLFASAAMLASTPANMANPNLLSS